MYCIKVLEQIISFKMVYIKYFVTGKTRDKIEIKLEIKSAYLSSLIIKSAYLSALINVEVIF